MHLLSIVQGNHDEQRGAILSAELRPCQHAGTEATGALRLIVPHARWRVEAV